MFTLRIRTEPGCKNLMRNYFIYTISTFDEPFQGIIHFFLNSKYAPHILIKIFDQQLQQIVYAHNHAHIQ